jgi:hypothetical protein
MIQDRLSTYFGNLYRLTIFQYQGVAQQRLQLLLIYGERSVGSNELVGQNFKNLFDGFRDGA